MEGFVVEDGIKTSGNHKLDIYRTYRVLISFSPDWSD